MPDFEQTEIVIVTFLEVAKEIQLFLKAHYGDLQSILNTVIWTVDKIPKTDLLLIKLYSGKHIDEQLNSAMSAGIRCKQPAREFLSSPDIPDWRFASIIGRRLLASIAIGTKTVDITQFLGENKDLAISFSRLRGVFAALFRMVPELGSFERRSGTIKLKMRVDYSIVQRKLRDIGKMSKLDYHRALGLPLEKEPEMQVEEIKPSKQITMLDFLGDYGKTFSKTKGSRGES